MTAMRGGLLLDSRGQGGEDGETKMENMVFVPQLARGTGSDLLSRWGEQAGTESVFWMKCLGDLRQSTVTPWFRYEIHGGCKSGRRGDLSRAWGAWKMARMRPFPVGGAAGAEAECRTPTAPPPPGSWLTG